MPLPAKIRDRVEFRVGFSATKAYNPDYRPNNASDPPTETMVNLVHGITLNTSDEGMVSAVDPSSYIRVVVRGYLNGIKHHNVGVTKSTQIYRHKDVYYHNGNRDPITRTILFTYEYAFQIVQLNRLGPDYMKDAVKVITDDESYYMITAHRFYESKFRGFDEIETIMSFSVKDYQSVTPPDQYDASIWDPRHRHTPSECIRNPFWFYPPLFDRVTLTVIDDRYSWERMNCSTAYIQQNINPKIHPILVRNYSLIISKKRI